MNLYSLKLDIIMSSILTKVTQPFTQMLTIEMETEQTTGGTTTYSGQQTPNTLLCSWKEHILEKIYALCSQAICILFWSLLYTRTGINQEVEVGIAKISMMRFRRLLGCTLHTKCFSVEQDWYHLQDHRFLYFEDALITYEVK